MLAILWLLRSRRSMTAEALARELEVSVRTVYRYVDSLCASGVPVVGDGGPDGGYRLLPGFRAAPLFFSPQELAALFEAAELAYGAGSPSLDALESALGKIEQNLTVEQRRELEDHLEGFDVVENPRSGPAAVWLDALEAAVANRVTLAVAYQKPVDAQPEERLLDPYGLSYQNGIWLLVAWCHSRQAIRHFRVDRIAGLRSTGEAFRRPEGFSLAEHLRDGSESVRERLARGPLIEVKLIGEPAAIAALAEHWYLRLCLVKRTPRTAVFRVDPQGVRHMPPHLLQFGTRIRVTSPAELKQAVATLAQAWAEHHAVPNTAWEVPER